jgi:hypothetical protein
MVKRIAQKNQKQIERIRENLHVTMISQGEKGPGGNTGAPHASKGNDAAAQRTIRGIRKTKTDDLKLFLLGGNA